MCGCSYKISKINSHPHFNPQQFSVIHNKINNWQLRGKISWHEKRQNKSTICYLNWQKNNSKSTITLYSALNMQNLVIETIENHNNRQNNIKIISKNGKNYHNVNHKTAMNSETVALQQAIESLPLNLNYLTCWLLGMPDLSKKYILINDGFKQDNWTVTYSDYINYQRTNVQNLFMPKKIVIHNSNMVIKIMVTNFSSQ